jgi:hypothetical protein
MSSNERCETSLVRLMCRVDHPYPYTPPPPFYLPDMWGENYICILSAEEQFLSTQCRCHSVFCHTGSHYIIIIFNLNTISLLLLTLSKSKLNFLLAVAMPIFLLGPLAC